MEKKLPDYQGVLDKRILERKKVKTTYLQACLNSLPDLNNNAVEVHIGQDDNVSDTGN